MLNCIPIRLHGELRRRAALAASLLPFVASVLSAQAEMQKRPVSGYFNAATRPDFSNVLPPAPKAGDIRDETDRAIFRATRSFEGSPRWNLAHKDNNLSVDGLLQAFACALGVTLTSGNAPRLSALLARISVDSNSIDGFLKDQYQRKRPFLTQDGPICIERSPALVNSFDYPSGHTALGWLTGLVLADLLPNRAGAILIRARAFGESRIVCGVHNASAVEGGRTLGSAIFAALHAVPDFRKDLESAKTEMEQLALKNGATASASCSAETALIVPSPYSSIPNASPVNQQPE